MRDCLLITTAAVAALAAVLVVVPSLSAAQAPPMGGGYTNVIPIPIDNDPQVKAIAGALFKPKGKGPYPGVAYMPVCGGLEPAPERVTEKRMVRHLLSNGFAVLIVDPHTARGENWGICKQTTSRDAGTVLRLAIRGDYDARAAAKALAASPGVDPNRIFLLGRSWGAVNVIGAIDAALPPMVDVKIRGVVAYYPYCYAGLNPTAPTLVLIGYKDKVAPASLCLAVKQRNFKVVPYPGATHAFDLPDMGIVFEGERFIHDEAATRDAERRSVAFMRTNGR